MRLRSETKAMLKKHKKQKSSNQRDITEINATKTNDFMMLQNNIVSNEDISSFVYFLNSFEQPSVQFKKSEDNSASNKFPQSKRYQIDSPIILNNDISQIEKQNSEVFFTNISVCDEKAEKCMEIPQENIIQEKSSREDRIEKIDSKEENAISLPSPEEEEEKGISSNDKVFDTTSKDESVINLSLEKKRYSDDVYNKEMKYRTEEPANKREEKKNDDEENINQELAKKKRETEQIASEREYEMIKEPKQDHHKKQKTMNKTHTSMSKSNEMKNTTEIIHQKPNFSPKKKKKSTKVYYPVLSPPVFYMTPPANYGWYAVPFVPFSPPPFYYFYSPYQYE